MKISTLSLAALAVAGALVATGAQAQSRDQIRIVGSSTVFPYTQAVAEQFAAATGGAAPVVESTGTGGGMKIFCGGVGPDHPDITGASRAMKKSEFELCAQNGVNNERLALRLFPNVYAMTVILPADYVTPGEVICYGAPKRGLIDLGRYPHGLDDNVAAIATAVNSAGFAAFPLEQVMRSKYGKLRDNLGNVVEAALGHGSRSGPLLEAIQAAWIEEV